jgi:hypothetical protein
MFGVVVIYQFTMLDKSTPYVQIVVPAGFALSGPNKSIKGYGQTASLQCSNREDGLTVGQWEDSGGGAGRGSIGA